MSWLATCHGRTRSASLPAAAGLTAPAQPQDGQNRTGGQDGNDRGPHQQRGGERRAPASAGSATDVRATVMVSRFAQHLSQRPATSHPSVLDSFQ